MTEAELRSNRVAWEKVDPRARWAIPKGATIWLERDWYRWETDELAGSVSAHGHRSDTKIRRVLSDGIHGTDRG